MPHIWQREKNAGVGISLLILTGIEKQRNILPRRAQAAPTSPGNNVDIQSVGWPDSLECSAPSSAIARDARSRSKTAAITPHTTATTNAIQEKRVSHRSAATPA